MFTLRELEAAAELVHRVMPPTLSVDWPLLSEAVGAAMPRVVAQTTQQLSASRHSRLLLAARHRPSASPKRAIVSAPMGCAFATAGQWSHCWRAALVFALSARAQAECHQGGAAAHCQGPLLQADALAGHVWLGSHGLARHRVRLPGELRALAPRRVAQFDLPAERAAQSAAESYPGALRASKAPLCRSRSSNGPRQKRGPR